MIDIDYLRKNPETVKTKSKQKGFDIDVELIIDTDNQRKKILSEIESLRQKRNQLSEKGKQDVRSADFIKEARDLKQRLVDLETRFNELDAKLITFMREVPNMSLDDVPVGFSEEENVVSKQVGKIPQFTFKAKAHHELAEKLDLIDNVRASKISGSRFAYIKNDLVKLQFAIINFVMDVLTNEVIIKKLIDENSLNLVSKPFTPVLPPALIKTEPYVASSRLNAEEVTYKIEQDDLWLNASAEHSLCTMYWNEILPEEVLPIRYIGYATSFRREAGTYGKDTEGIFRMHQFDKLEMEIFSSAETGLDEHYLMIAVQEYLMQQLKLPYRVLQKCTADIGKPNARGIDIEVWLPGQNQYRETHTADYMTDYQTRDLKIRSKKGSEETKLLHTNDATAFALGRIMIAIMENYQTGKGEVSVPEVLIPYMMGKTIIK